MMCKSVDIIIPIYNAFEDLCLCIDSLEKYTDLSVHRLVLVNDNSTDIRIRPYLEKYRNKGYVIVHNRENKGFSANINIGMKQSEANDVILLNSDTIVTKNWVEKMQNCAYSNVSIGTVTPLSNNATLCSVPVGFAENTLPEYLSVDDAAAIVERCSCREYPQIPVAHGFCMYVKREVIETIGGFDAATFQKGYGEENDFCNRAEQVGYIHVMCDDTYIYHSGTKSFLSKEKLKLMQDHEKVLKNRYPRQMRNLEIYCAANPNLHIQKNIGSFFEISNKKKNVLYVLHADFKEGCTNNVGGTQLHVKDLMLQMRDDYNVFVASRDGDSLQFTAYVGEKSLEWSFYIGKEELYFEDSQRNLRKIFSEILDAFQIDLLHVHHLKGLSFDILELAHERKIPIAVTIHDFYLVCPNLTLLDEKNQYCGGLCTEKCQSCLCSKSGIYEGIDYLNNWRIRVKKWLSYANCFFFPSKSAEKNFTGIYPEIADRSYVIEHGIDFEYRTGTYSTGDGNRTSQEQAEIGMEGEILAENNEFSDEMEKNKTVDEKNKKMNRQLHVAFLGGISTEKGGKEIAQIIKKGSRDIQWYTIGNIGDPTLANLQQKNYTAVGKYDRDHLPELFEKYCIDVVAVLSICPETYSYTLSEAMNLKKPVIVTDIGALGERVRMIDAGIVIPTDDIVESFLYAISKFTNAEYLFEMKKRAKCVKLPTLQDMGERYKQRYAEMIKGVPVYGSFDQKFIADAYARATAIVATSACGISPLELEYYKALRESLTFKLVEKLVRIPFPFKVQIMRWIYQRRGMRV